MDQTSTDTDGAASVLVVDDDEELAETYAFWLGDEYDVTIATGGAEALERADPEVDVVLLDRRMPGRSGDQVLHELRERGYDCRVSMVTAVEPDASILDMPFDDYLVKPVERPELIRAVDELLAIAEFDDGFQELFALGSKLAALENTGVATCPKVADEIERIREEFEARREELGSTLDDVDRAESAFRAVEPPRDASLQR